MGGDAKQVYFFIWPYLRFDSICALSPDYNQSIDIRGDTCLRVQIQLLTFR